MTVQHTASESAGRRWALVASSVAACAQAAACAAMPALRETTPPHLLDAALPWRPEVRLTLDAMLAAQHARCGSPAPVAVLDWDNTVAKNDVGDALFFWMLRHDKVRRPAGGDWGLTSRYLTPAARGRLAQVCGGAGETVPTSTGTACADELLSLYLDQRTTDGQPAFTGYHPRRMQPAYAWLAQLIAGYTADEVRAFASAAIDEGLGAPVGATQTVGSRGGLPGYLRLYDQMKDLIGVLGDAGFDVWIVSASPQAAVEAFAARAGVSAGRVIGIRTQRDARGRYTHELSGCGPAAAGDDAVITYGAGKRCWMNKVVFGADGADALERASEPGRRPVFAAGDSDSDGEMLSDAAVRLVIDRGAHGLACLARLGVNDHWLVHPMFIDPLPADRPPPACPALPR